MKKSFLAGVALGLTAGVALNCKKKAVLFFKTVKCGSDLVKECKCDDEK